MAVKVKLRGNQKAMVRFTNQMDEQYFIHILRQHRDDKQPHPDISIKSVRKKNILVCQKNAYANQTSQSS